MSHGVIHNLLCFLFSWFRNIEQKNAILCIRFLFSWLLVKFWWKKISGVWNKPANFFLSKLQRSTDHIFKSRAFFEQLTSMFFWLEFFFPLKKKTFNFFTEQSRQNSSFEIFFSKLSQTRCGLFCECEKKSQFSKLKIRQVLTSKKIFTSVKSLARLLDVCPMAWYRTWFSFCCHGPGT